MSEQNKKTGKPQNQGNRQNPFDMNKNKGGNQNLIMSGYMPY